MTSLIVGLLIAIQGTPVYTSVGTTGPFQGQACDGSRVQIRASDGLQFCCVSSKWNLCGPYSQVPFIIAQPSVALPGAQALSDFVNNGLAVVYKDTGNLAPYEGDAAVANQFITGLSATGVATRAQPAFTNLTGAATLAQLPTGTGYLKSTGAAPAYSLINLTAAADVAANQGTATTLLHGNAAGQAAWSGVAIADHTATGTPGGTTFLRGDNTWSVPAGTYTLPDATNLVTGGVRLTGDLGGTAISPTVPGLAGKEPTITTLPQTKGGTGAGALTCAGGQHLTSNGTVYSCTADTTYTLPAASTTLGGVKQAAGCAAGNHVSSIGAGGELTCTVDSGGALAAATATVLGGVKGNGTTTACTGTDKMTGWDAAGAMTCAADAGAGGAPNYVEVDVTFAATGDNLVTTVVTGQAWVTATSKITCSPTMLATSTKAEGEEDAVIERLSAAIHTRVAGTGFSLTVMPAEGDASGVFKFHCVGG